jgi:riboflavin kinase/FMN adenylyltransferase
MSVSVAVGVFDGLHRGHQALIRRARERAEGGRCIALSFDPHPDLVLAKEFHAQPPLTPLPEKQERLAREGVELHVLPFTRELAGLDPEGFVERHLVRPFAPRWLVVGEDFALGRGRSGNVARLRAIGEGSGFGVDAVPLLVEDGEAVSSTRIRSLLERGDVRAAARLLGRRYGLTGTVVHGDALGRVLGYPTANLRLHDEKCVPALGIYAVWARLEGRPGWLGGAMSVGIRPTFGGQVRTLEVFLLDFSGDLYGRWVEVEFVDWLRPELKFESTEALVQAIHEDVVHTRQRLAADPRTREDIVDRSTP